MRLTDGAARSRRATSQASLSRRVPEPGRRARSWPGLPHRTDSASASDGLAILSFTNSAIEEFISPVSRSRSEHCLCHPDLSERSIHSCVSCSSLPAESRVSLFGQPVVDSWETLGVDVRLRGANAFPRRRSSDSTCSTQKTTQIDPSLDRAYWTAHPCPRQPGGLPDTLRNVRRHALRQRGYSSAADVRVDVVAFFSGAHWSTALGTALAARFHEVIVDEAQTAIPSTVRSFGGCVKRHHRHASLLIPIRRYMDSDIGSPDRASDHCQRL